MNKYDPYYDPIYHESDAWSCIRTVAGKSLVVRLDNETPTSYRWLADDNRTLLDVSDAVLMILNPALPLAIDEALESRLEHFENVISAEDEVFERVVIVKDIGMSWKTKMSLWYIDPNERAEGVA